MPKMSCRSESSEVEDCCVELEYDMWDGQFDFVGPQVRPIVNSESDTLEDLFTGSPLTPHIKNGTNGTKKTMAHHWCDNLTGQVQLLQQQVTVLADTQNTADDRYTRVKAENAGLQARVHMLEEQLRDMEVRCEERITEEQRRGREAVLRIERDRDSQLENLQTRLVAAETEAGNLRQEAGRLRGVSEGLRLGVDAESQRLREAQDSVASLTLQLQQSKEAHRKAKQAHDRDSQLLSEMQKELEKTKAELAARNTAQVDSVDGNWGKPDLLRLEELHEDLNRLRQENKTLSEAHEELQAQMLTKGLETGRSLLGPPLHSSLAAELTQMTNDQFGGFPQDHYSTQYEKIQKALKEQQDVNSQLRSYIDGILLQIVENYPQLLEVKASGRSS